MIVYLVERIKPLWRVIIILFFMIGLFFSLNLPTWDAFIFRPGSSVSDLMITFWPNIHYIQESLTQYGEYPLWRTLIFSGSPFAADPQSGLWYPPNLIFFFLPIEKGFNVLFLLHLVGAGIGMWLWSKATGTSSAGGLLSAIAYAFTPKIFAHLGFGHVGLVYAAAYVPWVLWAGYRIGNGYWRYAGLLGLALGIQFIAFPQLAFYSGVVAGVYVYVIGFSSAKSHQDKKHFIIAISGLILGGLLAMSVAAVQIFPMLRFVPLSARGGMTLNDAVRTSLPWRYLLGLVLADHGGFMDYMLYMGIPVVFLALLVFSRRHARFWWAFVLLAIIYSLGENTPLYPLAIRVLPILAWMWAPSKIIFVAAAVLALLSGWGFDRLLKGVQGRRLKLINMVSVGFGGFAGMLVLGYALGVGSPPLNLVVFGCVVPATAALCMIIAAGKIPRWAAVVTMSVLFLADIWIVDATLIDGRSRSEIFVDNDLYDYLSQQISGEAFRIYSPSYSLPRHIAAQLGIETADGVDPLYLDEYDQFMQLTSGVQREMYGITIPPMEGEGPVHLLNRNAVPRPELLGLLNVKYVAAEFPLEMDGLLEVGKFETTYLYENELFLPRAYIIGKTVQVNDYASALAWMRDSYEVNKAAVEYELVLNEDVKSSINHIKYSPNRIELEISLDSPGLLVLSQIWYPNWRAWVDGQLQSLLRVDGILSGLVLEEGTHKVQIMYPYDTIFLGLGLSVLGLIISIILFYRSVST